MPVFSEVLRVKVRVNEGCLDHGLVEPCLRGTGLGFDDKDEVLVLVATVGDP